MLRTASVAAIFIVLAIPMLANAEEKPTGPASAAPPARRVHWSAGIGLYGASRYAGGGLVDFFAAGRFGPFAVGGNLQGGTELKVLSGNTFFSIAPVAGIFAPTPRWLEVGIFASVGVRHYEKLGYKFLGSPGFSATLPFAGVRGIVAIATGKDSGGLTVGLHGFVDTDLMRWTYTYDDDTTERVWRYAGRVQYGGILALGATF